LKGRKFLRKVRNSQVLYGEKEEGDNNEWDGLDYSQNNLGLAGEGYPSDVNPAE